MPCRHSQITRCTISRSRPRQPPASPRRSSHHRSRRRCPRAGQKKHASHNPRPHSRSCKRTGRLPRSRKQGPEATRGTRPPCPNSAELEQGLTERAARGASWAWGGGFGARSGAAREPNAEAGRRHGAHIKHGCRDRVAGGVEAQRLVEPTCVLPSGKGRVWGERGGMRGQGGGARA